MQKVRIDDRTEIWIKDDQDPEARKKNFIAKYMGSLKLAEKAVFNHHAKENGK